MCIYRNIRYLVHYNFDIVIHYNYFLTANISNLKEALLPSNIILYSTYINLLENQLH